MTNFNDRRQGNQRGVFSLRTPDMGLMSVVPKKGGGAIVRHEASGQEQHHADYDKAVADVKGK